MKSGFEHKSESEYISEIAKLRAQHDDLKNTFTSMISVLQKTIEDQGAEIQKLLSKIDELMDMQNKNSKNSSKPPSSDGYKKPAPKSLREKSGKKAGGQQGHKGNGLKIMREPDEVKVHKPCQCMGCPHTNICAGRTSETRYEIDINVSTKIIAHKALVYQCPNMGGTELKGNFPAGINSTVQYGDNLAALAIALNTEGMVSLKRTHDLLSSVFGIPISNGTIASMVLRLANQVVPIVEMIKEKVSSLGVAHFDETGIRVDGKLNWVHSASNSAFTYLSIESKRGKQGMDSSGVLPHFTGIAIHDCWSTYFQYEGITHGLCNAHILRELTGILENTGQQWAKSFIDLLLEMKKSKESLLSRGVNYFSAEQWELFSAKYNLLTTTGIALNPVPNRTPGKRGRAKRSKARALVDRLVLYKEGVCLFATDFSVPFDNNQAERDLRMIKVKQKVSGSFRTKTGAEAFASIMSYTGTAKKHGISVYDAIKNALKKLPAKFNFA